MADTTRLPGPLGERWEWQLDAACRGLDVAIFYHPPGERTQGRDKRIIAAKRICTTCPVITACRDHALRVREPYGIWGGLSESERADLLGVASLRYPARTRQQPLRDPDHRRAGTSSDADYQTAARSRHRRREPNAH